MRGGEAGVLRAVSAGCPASREGATPNACSLACRLMATTRETLREAPAPEPAEDLLFFRGPRGIVRRSRNPSSPPRPPPGRRDNHPRPSLLRGRGKSVAQNPNGHHGSRPCGTVMQKERTPPAKRHNSQKQSRALPNNSAELATNKLEARRQNWRFERPACCVRCAFLFFERHACALELQSGDFPALLWRDSAMLSQALDRVLGVVRLPAGALFLHHGDPQGPTSVVPWG